VADIAQALDATWESNGGSDWRSELIVDTSRLFVALSGIAGAGAELLFLSSHATLVSV
jgi:hypothetical protein